MTADRMLLHAEGLERRFGGLTAIKNVSLSVAPRQMKCIIGPNGAGKSTFLNLLCGTLRPTAGRVVFNGADITGMALHRIARIGIARKFQVPSVFERLSVAENLGVADIGVTHDGRRPNTVDDILDRLELREIAHRRAGDLAHGQKQWLEIGMAMMTNPKLLLLDEPTAGMTVEESLRTAALLRAACDDIAVIAIEHDMRFVRALACHTVVLHQGALIAEGAFAEVEANPMVRDVYLGRQ
jgi:urea ABC transporter ATP-binding protein UrtD